VEEIKLWQCGKLQVGAMTVIVIRPEHARAISQALLQAGLMPLGHLGVKDGDSVAVEVSELRVVVTHGTRVLPMQLLTEEAASFGSIQTALASLALDLGLTEEDAADAIRGFAAAVRADTELTRLAESKLDPKVKH
jgi:hypothetical protein